ncbi:MAG: hypothetical protein QGF78_00515 [Candidatus Bathyarchaeota archaeon]|jgi:vacuolar-type H+-ATPase subunit H|nr:hypothetical protein [Candidatus Bathyarchaeota archaeon]|tara:strand:- start:175 stop:507 length:333 start_codon:yes stop_codon:yes gene_type:complete
MGTESVLSIGERLQKLLANAEVEAKAMITEAQSTTNEKITAANNKASRKRAMAQRGTGIEELLKDEEKKAKKEAKKILKDYKVQAEALRDVPEDKVREAIETVMKEVLRQ